jgi:hypothetical protein
MVNFDWTATAIVLLTAIFVLSISKLKNQLTIYLFQTL